MDDLAVAFARALPAVAIVLAILWAGWRGVWYWGAATRRVIALLEHDRDDWQRLAMILLRERGIAVPPEGNARDAWRASEAAKDREGD